MPHKCLQLRVGHGAKGDRVLRALHDVEDPEADLWADLDEGILSISVGPESGRTTIFGACNASDQVVGHTGWDTDDDASMMDDNDASGDRTAHWIQQDLTIDDGDTASFGFLITVGEDLEEAVNSYIDQVDILCTE